MVAIEKEIHRYEEKIRSCTTMTELLVAMSSWQTFADSHSLSKDDRKSVEEAYVQAEAQLITNVKPILW